MHKAWLGGCEAGEEKLCQWIGLWGGGKKLLTTRLGDDGLPLDELFISYHPSRLNSGKNNPTNSVKITQLSTRNGH